MSTFEIMAHLAGIKTREGVELLSLIKEIETGSIYRIVFKNGSMLWVRYFSIFIFSPGTSHMVYGKWSGTGAYTRESIEYWKEFREAVKEVALLYEFEEDRGCSTL